MAPLCKGGCQKSLISDWGIAPLYIRTSKPKPQSLRPVCALGTSLYTREALRYGPLVWHAGITVDPQGFS